MLADADIDKEMTETWREIQARNAPEPEAVSQEATPVAEAAPAEVKEASPEPVKAEPVKADRARDESGKFAKAAEVKADPAATAEPVKTESAPEPVGRDINRPPSSWTPAAKAMWEKIPPELRNEIQRREGDFLSGQSQLIPDAKFGKNLKSVIQPFEAMIAGEGGTPETAVNELLRTAAALRMGSMEYKIATVKGILQRYGIPPEALAGVQGEAQPQQQQYHDPRVTQLLEQQQRERESQQHAENQRLMKVASDWMSATDPQGRPLRPYVDNVMTEMQALIPLISQQSPHLQHQDVLQQAYDRAIWANPETAKVVKQQEIEALEAQRRAENQRQVSEAKKASSVNVQRRGSTPAPAKPGSIEETIRNTGRALGMF